jgi:hypothetical protein
MTITTYGYAGEVDEIAYAQSNVLSGVRYGVSGYADFRPTVGVGDRAVAIAAGEAMGGGVRAVNSDPVTVNHASVGAGSRWDMIVLRRDWSDGSATLVIIEGTSTKALPTRNDDIGDVDDQPIALVRVVASSSVVAEIVDLRVFSGDGGLYARDPLVLQFMDRVGTVIRIIDRLWFRTIGSGGSPTWARHDVQWDTGWVNATGSSGWAWQYCQVRRIGGVIFFRMSATRSVGWSTAAALASLPVGYRPDNAHAQANSAAVGGFVFYPNGSVQAGSASGGATTVHLHGSFPAPITD